MYSWRCEGLVGFQGMQGKRVRECKGVGVGGSSVEAMLAGYGRLGGR